MASDGGMTACAGLFDDGAHSQVVFRDGVWWHFRFLPTLGIHAVVTGHDPQPTRRALDVAATRARVELAASLGGVR